VKPSIACCFLAVTLIFGSTFGDDSASVDKQRVAWLLGKISARRMVPTRQSDTPCKLHSEPIFKWSNPVSGAEGAVFVWTSDGRPIAITKNHLNSRKSFYSETTNSVSDNLPRMIEGDLVSWEPSEPGVKFEIIDQLGPPATTASQRLAQMRRVLREFRIVDNWGQMPASSSAPDLELRIMPTPLFRYSSESNKIIDGALFAFAQGTNPEAIVLIEAIETADGRLVWRAACSRMTIFPVRAWYKERLVFEAERIERINGLNPKGSTIYRFEPLNPFPFPKDPPGQ